MYITALRKQMTYYKMAIFSQKGFINSVQFQSIFQIIFNGLDKFYVWTQKICGHNKYRQPFEEYEVKFMINKRFLLMGDTIHYLQTDRNKEKGRGQKMMMLHIMIT